MNSTTSKTVRMFDGEKWDTYKRGGKKHRAAEARRAEFDAKRTSRKERNQAFAPILREHDITPKGPAWDVVTSWADEGGRTDVDLRFCLEAEPEFVGKLRDLNAAAGVKAPSEFAAEREAKQAAKPVKAKKAKASKTAEPASKPVGKKAKQRKARSEAARKGWETRRANEAARKAAEKAARKGKKGKKAKKQGAVIAANPFEAVGFSPAQVVAIEAIIAAQKAAAQESMY